MRIDCLLGFQYSHRIPGLVETEVGAGNDAHGRRRSGRIAGDFLDLASGGHCLPWLIQVCQPGAAPQPGRCIGVVDVDRPVKAGKCLLISTEARQDPGAEIGPAEVARIEQSGILVTDLGGSIEAVGIVGHGQRPATGR